MKKPNLIGKNHNSLREAFGIHLSNLAKKNKKIVVLDADIAGGTGAHHFRSKFKDRFIQCGIAEQNMVSMSAGISKIGYIPFVTTFAVFLIRCIEQVRLSIAYSKENVKLIASHPGLDVGPDGASAQCIEDLAIFRAIPNMTVISPSDSNEMKQAIKEIVKFKGPVYMRTGRSAVPNILENKNQFKIGKGQVIMKGKKITLISCGIMTHRALEAAKKIKSIFNISINLINMPTIKPIDEEIIKKFGKKSKHIITAEDHNIVGGLGSAVSEVISKNQIDVKQIFIGVRDCFGESGEPDELAKKYKISSNYIFETIKKLGK